MREPAVHRGEEGQSLSSGTATLEAEGVLGLLEGETDQGNRSFERRAYEEALGQALRVRR